MRRRRAQGRATTAPVRFGTRHGTNQRLAGWAARGTASGSSCTRAPNPCRSSRPSSPSNGQASSGRRLTDSARCRNDLTIAAAFSCVPNHCNGLRTIAANLMRHRWTHAVLRESGHATVPGAMCSDGQRVPDRWIGVDFSGNQAMWKKGCTTSNVWIADVRQGGHDQNPSGSGPTVTRETLACDQLTPQGRSG